MRINRLLMLVVVVGLLVSMVGVVVPLVGSASAQEAGDPLVLGVIGEVTSPTARGLEVAAMRLNANGPFRIGAKAYVVTVSTKTASTPDELKTAIDELKANGAVAIFGPDDDTLAKAGESILAEAGLPIFTGATDPAVKVGDLIFRTRTNDTVLMNALAEALVAELKQAKIVVYQGSETFAAKGAAFAKALAERQVTPASVLIQTGDVQLVDVAKEIMTGAPEVIVALAAPEQVSELYLALRADGFEGTFATSAIENPDFVATLPEAQRRNLYGVSNWTNGSIRKDSIDFTRDYEEMFKAKPHGLSAAAYDAAVAMVFAYRRAGLDTQAGIAQLLRFPRADSLQGTFNAQLGNNELSADASVIVTGANGAPGIFLRFNGAQRLLAENAVPTATPTPLPTETPLPTATPDGVVATVNVRVLNVRSGPALTFEQIGTLTRGQQVPVIGANADFSFLLIPYRGDQAWIMAQFVTIFGDRSKVPIVVGPPPPVEPTATPAPTGVPTADIAFVSANFTPTNLQPGVPFTLAVTLTNAGGVAAGEFAVATSFKPGDVYVAAIVAGLAPGQQTVVNLSATLSGTGAEQVAIIIDLNGQVDEGATGESNNNPVVTYKIDRPYAAQSSAVLQVNASVDLDLDAQPDATFIGTALNPTAQSALQQIQVTFNSVHYDFLASIMGGVGLGSISIGGPPAQGTVIGVRTTSGKFGLIQVVGYSGSDMQVNFFVYP